MTNCANFQTQITNIMEIMTTSAVAEITKLFDHRSSVLCLKISRSLHENKALEKKLQLVQHELTTALREKEERGARDNPVKTRSVGVQVFVDEEQRGRVFGQEPNFSLREDGEPAGVEEFANMEEVWTEPVFIKQERLEEELLDSDLGPTLVEEGGVTQPTPVEDGKKLDTEPTPVGDPMELNEQYRCGHGDEELSALEFVVKSEQEEERVAQKLNRTGCEHSTGKLDSLGSEYVIYERDSQLWTSFTQGDSDIETDDAVCFNAMKQHSQNLSVDAQLHYAPATMEFSGSTLSSFGASCLEVDKIVAMPSVSSEELRSEAIHTQQGQYRESFMQRVERENQILLPQQQQHGPSVKCRRGSESLSQSLSGSTVTACALSKGKKGKTSRRAVICTYCGKSFDGCGNLFRHQRVHTGEKPYSCSQCGKCFSLKGNLVKHERVHSGYKPFGCTQCGKSFAHGANLRTHQRIHTGEKPYHCTQCGKSFTQKTTLVVHQRTHTRVKPYSCS